MSEHLHILSATEFRARIISFLESKGVRLEPFDERSFFSRLNSLSNAQCSDTLAARQVQAAIDESRADFLKQVDPMEIVAVMHG